MTDPHVHEDREVIVDRETVTQAQSPLGVILAVVAVIAVVILVWWLVAGQGPSGSGTNPGGAPGGTAKPTEQAPGPSAPPAA
jgi:hypothetical protein